MTRIIIPIVLFSLLFSGCELKNEIIDQIPNGTYTGIFQRDPIFADGTIANVSITFSTSKWNGQSDMEKYPALCSESYLLEIDNCNICDNIKDEYFGF